MKKGSCLGIILFLLLCVSGFLNFVQFALLFKKSRASSTPHKVFEEEVVLPGTSSSSKIVVIPLMGIIGFTQSNSLGDHMVTDLLEAFQQAGTDPQVKAVVISTDSPGGEVSASDALYHAIQNLAKRKPVIYYMNSIGASGAYYAACGSSWIMCAPTTFTGSIGVIISAFNYKDLLGKIGLQSVVFKSGKFKDMLSGAREMTPEEKAYIQGLVMQTYDRFLNIVADARHLSAVSLREGVADGRILSGTDAFREKLVDGLGYIEDAFAKAQELGNAKEAKVVRYKPSFSFTDLVRFLAQSPAPQIRVKLFEQTPILQPGRFYLLPSLLVP